MFGDCWYLLVYLIYLCLVFSLSSLCPFIYYVLLPLHYFFIFIWPCHYRKSHAIALRNIYFLLLFNRRLWYFSGLFKIVSIDATIHLDLYCWLIISVRISACHLIISAIVSFVIYFYPCRSQLSESKVSCTYFFTAFRICFEAFAYMFSNSDSYHSMIFYRNLVPVYFPLLPSKCDVLCRFSSFFGLFENCQFMFINILLYHGQTML